MDMKKFIQAVDKNVSNTPVDSSEMKKFRSIVEGKNTATNRLTMAEQMAVQHYQEQSHTAINTQVLNVDKDAKPSMVGKYFKQVEEELAEAADRSKQQSQSRAKQLAERVLNSMYKDRRQNAQEADGDDKIDTVTMDVPLLLRIMEYAKEDAKTDMDLHNVTEKLIAFSKETDVLSMDQYDAIVGNQEALPAPDDTSKTEESLRTENPCWKGYKPVGTKKKNGKTVPNCVPKESLDETTKPAYSPHLKPLPGGKVELIGPGELDPASPKFEIPTSYGVYANAQQADKAYKDLLKVFDDLMTFPSPIVVKQ